MIRPGFILLMLAVAVAAAAQAPSPKRLQTARLLKTPGGIRFALAGPEQPRRAPLLFVLGADCRLSLEREDFNEVGALLAPKGYLQAAIDTPGHGDDRRPGEPEGIAAWRTRLEKGENPIAAFVESLRTVLTHLIDQGWVDPERVGVAGSSRGGFLALHAAAGDPRLRYVVAFAPVSDLLAVREFNGMVNPASARALDIMPLAEKLTGRSLLISIGHNDQRVGTQHVIDFALRLMQLAAPPGKVMTHFWSSDEVKFILSPSEGANGHSTYRHAHDDAAAWILQRTGS